MTSPRIAIILGSTRPGRRGEAVAQWVYDRASKRDDAQFEIVDLRDYELPLLDEVNSPVANRYQNDHTKTWAARIARFDGYLFVTPEYNRSTSGALKNAIDYLYAEWNNKAAGFIGYGATAGGAHAIDHLRGMMAELQIAHVRAQVTFDVMTEWEDNLTTFTPRGHREDELTRELDQLIRWSNAMRIARAGA
ncbi:NAD(P)H-dependent oxidoreductase [Actinoplanes sp. TBRC 11911]|uniref:NADPH-dependent FMN reductase n=1 Tax=Actinoplanes sp. TBRC 11911 TaxID=2729386 RepID=UPI00145CEE13|nr:NAD(P)H-dependent oxidoreductase [Actinoplanes sp. TBRC 11911]NMO52457.1 NAD(P)H-dependent oxidoreductase [Actinoplanes sp. TBRC 11911]